MTNWEAVEYAVLGYKRYCDSHPNMLEWDDLPEYIKLGWLRYGESCALAYEQFGVSKMICPGCDEALGGDLTPVDATLWHRRCFRSHVKTTLTDIPPDPVRLAQLEVLTRAGRWASSMELAPVDSEQWSNDVMALLGAVKTYHNAMKEAGGKLSEDAIK